MEKHESQIRRLSICNTFFIPKRIFSVNKIKSGRLCRPRGDEPRVIFNSGTVRDTGPSPLVPAPLPSWGGVGTSDAKDPVSPSTGGVYRDARWAGSGRVREYRGRGTRVVQGARPGISVVGLPRRRGDPTPSGTGHGRPLGKIRGGGVKSPPGVLKSPLLSSKETPLFGRGVGTWYLVGPTRVPLPPH